MFSQSVNCQALLLCLFFWGLIVTLFQRQADILTQDEFEKVDDMIFGAFIISLIFMHWFL